MAPPDGALWVRFWKHTLIPNGELKSVSPQSPDVGFFNLLTDPRCWPEKR